MQPTYQDTVQSINAFSPHILVFIGHGRTTAKGNAQLRFEKWINAHDLAAEIMSVCNQLFLVVLISCDTSWSVAVNPCACGPQAFISHGVPAVVAMQSKISTAFAGDFLDRLLSSLFSGASLPHCVTAARQGGYVTDADRADKSLEWAAPALFVSTSAFDVIQPMSRWREAYAIRLSSVESSFPRVGYYVPRQRLEKKISQWVEELTGIAVVAGIIGTGRTTLISQVCRRRYRAAIERYEPLPRPIIYLGMGDDCSPNLNAVLSQLNHLSAHHGLAPLTYEGGGKNEEHLLRFLDLKPAVLILDDADLLPAEELESLVKRCMQHLSRGLLVLVVGAELSMLTKLQQLPLLQIDPLSLDETVQYCHTVVGRNGNLAEKWYAESSGNLWLLSLLRSAGSTMELDPKSFLAPRDLSKEAEKFIHSLQLTLPSDLYDLLLDIAVLPNGVDKKWLTEMFGSDASNACIELHTKGLVVLRRGDGSEWVRVPTLTSVGLRNADTELEHHLNVLNSSRSFADDMGPDWAAIGHMPQELELFPGFVRLFRGLELLSLEMGQFDYAIHLARLLFEALKRLGRLSEARDVIETLLAAQKMETWSPENLLRLASVLHASGDTAYLSAVLEYLKELGTGQMSDFYQVTYWNLRAGCLKDQAAVERTTDMLKYYEQAESLAQKRLSRDGNQEREWLEQLAHTYHDKALVLRFMKRNLAASQQLLERSAELFQQAGLVVLKAKSDMERAEIQLDLPSHEPDWAMVENLLSSARSVFELHGSRGDLAFCMYQIGRMHKKKPDPNLEKAASAYAECEDRAVEAGLHRLAVISLRHRTELEWRSSNIDADGAITAIDSVVKTLAYFPGDAWSTRVMRDAEFLAAQMLLQRGKLDTALDRLRRAWDLAFQSPLHPYRESADRSRAARIALFSKETFGWSGDLELLSGLATMLGEGVPQQPREKVLSELQRISQEV